MEQTHIHNIAATVNRTLAFKTQSLFMPPTHLQHLPTQLLFVMEMVQRRVTRFCQNYSKTIEKGCMSEMIGKLNLEPIHIRRTNRRLFHKTLNGHLALPIGESSAMFASHSTS